MSRKHILLAVLIVAGAGWAVGISLSLRQLRNALPDPELLATPAGQSPVETTPTITSPRDIPPLAAQSTAEAVPAITPEELQVEAREEPSEPARAADRVWLSMLQMSAEERCEMLQTAKGGPLRGVFPTASSRHPEFYQDLSEGELKLMADDGDDGYAQYLYAHRVMWRLFAKAGSQNPLLFRDDELFATAQEYYIKAIRNHSRRAASQLASMYYGVDKTESRAWWVIEQEMGGDALAGVEKTPFYTFTDQEKSEGVARAEERIGDFDLATALPLPEECR